MAGLAKAALPRSTDAKNSECRAALREWLARESGAQGVEITAPKLMTGGAIQENWAIEAVFDGGVLAGAQPVVLRTDAATGVPSSLGRTEEFAVQRAAFAAGVTVAEPLWAGADRAENGEPFFVMHRVSGTAQERLIETDPALEPSLAGVAARLAAELARMQTIRPPRPDLGFLPQINAERHIAQFRAYLDRHPNPRPVLEWATAWLEAHIPEPLPPVLCHRDFRTGNYMLDSAVLTGILDWEFAGWGDPDEDIGWFCCKGWRFARLDREAGGIADRETFYRAYEAASGRLLDRRRVRVWEVLANVRWAVIALQQSDRCLIQGARDLGTAIIARRATECDLELLMLLDADKAPSPPPGTRVGARGRMVPPLPSPVSPPAGRPNPGSGPGEALSRSAKEGKGQADPMDPDPIRDVPSGAGLLALGREWLIDEVLPLLPAERHRDLRVVATAMAIAEREAAAGDAPAREIALLLREFYGRADSGGALLRRFAADLRAGAFERCDSRAAAARAILWRLTILKLREGNPGFLAENGFGD
jgi:aminoglycoside phosphotransferase (APT) family kinase protein